MRFISTNKQKSKYEYKCCLCGEIIQLGEGYTNAKYASSTSIKHLKCHCDCFITAQKLELLNRDSISSFTFIKKCREYIYDLHIRGGAKVTRKLVEKHPIRYLVDLIQKYFDELEAEHNQQPSIEMTRLVLNAFAIFMTLPTQIDNIVYELQEAGKYNYKLKSTLKQVVKDLEGTSNKLFGIYACDGFADELSFKGLDALEEIESHVMIEGVDKYANIFLNSVKILIEKWELINTEHNCATQVRDIKRIYKKVVDVMKYNEYSFIELITRKYMCNEFIKVV